jgi:hypothetical protein
VTKRNWTLEHTQAENVYALTFWVHRGGWKSAGGSFGVSAGVEVTGILEQFEQLAADLLQDIAAIRAEEGQRT